MSFDVPVNIEPMIQQYAAEQMISNDEAIVRLIQKGFSASHEGEADETHDHLFTPNVLAHIDAITAKIDAGEPTLDAAQVDARLASVRVDWQAKNAS